MSGVKVGGNSDRELEVIQSFSRVHRLAQPFNPMLPIDNVEGTHGFLVEFKQTVGFVELSGARRRQEHGGRQVSIAMLVRLGQVPRESSRAWLVQDPLVPFLAARLESINFVEVAREQVARRDVGQV